MGGVARRLDHDAGLVETGRHDPIGRQRRVGGADLVEDEGEDIGRFSRHGAGLSPDAHGNAIGAGRRAYCASACSGGSFASASRISCGQPACASGSLLFVANMSRIVIARRKAARATAGSETMLIR